MKKLVITFLAVIVMMAMQRPAFGQVGMVGLLGAGKATGGAGVSGAWSYVQGASGTEGTGGWEVQTNACGSTFSTQCTVQIATTPVGSDMMVGAVNGSGSGVHITSAYSCAGSPPCSSGNKIDTFTLCASSSCEENSALDNNDAAYVAGGAGGANYVTLNLSGTPSNFQFIEYGEVLPPLCGASRCATVVDNGGVGSVTSAGSSGCSPCTGPAFTITGEDGIIEIIDSNTSILAPTSPYLLDFIGNVFSLDNTSGSGVSFSTTSNYSLVGLAFKTTTSYTPLSQPWSDLAPGNQSVTTFTVACSPTCASITLPFTTTGTGDLIFVHAQSQPGVAQATISSIADNKSETWTVPSAASTCKQTGGTIDLSCGYVVTTSSGVSTITLTASTSTTLNVMLHELAASSGTITLDAQNSSHSSSSSATVTGQSLSLTGTVDACFAELGWAGTGSSPFEIEAYLYPSPQGSNFFGGYGPNSANGLSMMSLNQRNGNAPSALLSTSATSQESSGICFHN